MTAHLVPEFTGGGLGRMLVQGVARDAARRGIKAIEAFGRAKQPSEPEEASEWAAPRVRQRRPTGEQSCVLPADYLLAVGFKTVRPHPKTPRLRLDLKSTVSWKEDVEYALERLLSSMQAPVLAPR
jgi:hypothetical protein